jgi:hypothetical protein
VLTAPFTQSSSNPDALLYVYVYRTMRVRSDHPLRRFFSELVHKHLVSAAGIEDTNVADYVSGLLVEFTHVDNLYRVRNARGKRLEDVGEMLIESNPLLDGRSFFYEREVRKHIGDYTLFLTGLFPEHVHRLAKRGMTVDAFIDYMQAGKESYRIVASFDQFEFRQVAPVFRRISERFELCVFGLNLVKSEIEANQRGWYSGVRRALET